MKIKSRFALKRGVLLDLKISDFGWKGGVFLAQNPRKGGVFQAWVRIVIYVLVGNGGTGCGWQSAGLPCGSVDMVTTWKVQVVDCFPTNPHSIPIPHPHRQGPSTYEANLSDHPQQSTGLARCGLPRSPCGLAKVPVAASPLWQWQATGLDARASRVKWPAQFMSHWYGILFIEW